MGAYCMVCSALWRPKLGESPKQGAKCKHRADSLCYTVEHCEATMLQRKFKQTQHGSGTKADVHRSLKQSREARSEPWPWRQQHKWV